jgi:hypothetical protein
MTADFLPGLLWVENRIHQLSAELSRPVDCLEWPRPTGKACSRSGPSTDPENPPGKLLEEPGAKGDDIAVRDDKCGF